MTRAEFNALPECTVLILSDTSKYRNQKRSDVYLDHCKFELNECYDDSPDSFDNSRLVDFIDRRNDEMLKDSWGVAVSDDFIADLIVLKLGKG